MATDEDQPIPVDSSRAYGLGAHSTKLARKSIPSPSYDSHVQPIRTAATLCVFKVGNNNKKTPVVLQGLVPRPRSEMERRDRDPKLIEW